MASILVTGAAGFVGFHLSRRLVADGHEVLGLDNLNSYYDVELKHGRLRELGIDPQKLRPGEIAGGRGEARFVKLDLANRDGLMDLVARERPEVVVNLAAQAGVRYSLEHPHTYQESNLQGFLNLIEALRYHPVKHLIYASSSSVYGADASVPFREGAAADRPVSLYAATKRANELIAHSYAALYGIPATGLRFFTVYGPWGRPDMAYFLFTRAILAGEPIRVFNYGEMQRDFTYVDDIVEGVLRLLDRPPQSGPDDGVPARVLNIGNGSPVPLMHFIEAVEAELGVTAQKEMLPMQPGDVPITWADCSALEAITGFRPQTPVAEGMRRFVYWYRGFYGV